MTNDKNMIKVLAIIQVKDFTTLEKFESEAAKIMLDHGGKIICAFETQSNEDGTGEEIHWLEFASNEALQNYRTDDRHQQLKSLREKAISAIEVKISSRIKSYS